MAKRLWCEVCQATVGWFNFGVMYETGAALHRQLRHPELEPVRDLA